MDVRALQLLLAKEEEATACSSCGFAAQCCMYVRTISSATFRTPCIRANRSERRVCERLKRDLAPSPVDVVPEYNRCR